MGRFISTIRDLANEAEADERRVTTHLPKHRRVLTKSEIAAEKAHKVAKHVVHVFILAGVGLPGILAFETARPLWVKYVESPLSDMMVGSGGTYEYMHLTYEFLANRLNL